MVVKNLRIISVEKEFECVVMLYQYMLCGESVTIAMLFCRRLDDSAPVA